MSNENHVVHKSNDLIEAKFNLPLIEQRILAVCVSKINPTKHKLENPYRFSIKEYCALTGSDVNGMHQELKDALKRLQGRTLEKYDPDIGRTRFFNWTRKIDAWDSHSYDVYFHEEIEADLLAKTKYTEYLLKSAFNLRSKYSLRLYEMAKQRHGQARPPMFSVEKVRILFGVEEGIYQEYRDFKRRCLKLAIEEINDNTDLHIEINEFRKNRKVDLIEFIITESKPKAPKLKEVREKEKPKAHEGPDLFELLGPKSDLDAIIEKLQPLNVRASQCMNLIEEFTGPAVLLAYDQVMSMSIKEGTNIAGVLINKLKDAKEAKQAEGKKKLAQETAKVSIEDNREWWNKEGLEKLLIFWNGEKPFFLRDIPCRVNVEPYCFLNGETINFGKPNFKEYVLEEIEDFRARAKQAGRSF